MATHSNILAFKIPWTEEFGALQYMGKQKSWMQLSYYSSIKLLLFSFSPSNEHSGLISFRIDWFDLFAILAIVINTVWYWVGIDKLVKWSRIRNTEISTHIKQINFNRWILPSQFRRWRGSFFFNVARTNRYPDRKKWTSTQSHSIQKN